MGVNKVEFGGDTLIDLTSDTVTPDSLLSGVTAHSAAGETVVGKVITRDVIELDKATYDSLPDTKLDDDKLYFVTDWKQSGGSNDYDALDNKPQIHGKTIEGNKRPEDLGLSPILHVRKWSTTSTSLSAGSTRYIEIDVRVQGLYIIGCVGFYIGGTGTTNCYTKQAYVNEDGIFSMYIKNTGTSAVTPTVEAYILYVEDTI